MQSMTDTKPAAPSFTAIKERQQKMWASGDYACVGTTLQIVGESLCEALDLRAGERVLDVAAGNGNASLAAARRWCDVTATDYVPELLDRARERANAERLPLKIQIADAEALPFPDNSFDVVVSTFGVMFAPDQAKSASELVRVCRNGGKIGMANWTPGGFIGQLFKTIGAHVPPPAGVQSPARWGDKAVLGELLGERVSIGGQLKHFAFRYKSAAHWIEVFRGTYGPLLKAYETLDAKGQDALTAAITALIDKFNVSGSSAVVAPSEYFEAVIVKR
ncbi:MAG: class I SAM-dependent methyltransferase [Proteobacteria bacterium]|nr:class I SAM-dependent methyltransferase [Pseudomonadota bacterium]